MIGYILRRLVMAVFVLIAISLVSFIVIQLPPGDFAQSYKQHEQFDESSEAAIDWFSEHLSG